MQIIKQDEKRTFYSMFLPRLEAWPDRLDIDSGCFGLLLAYDARSGAEEALRALAERTLAQGLVYLCAWGPDCKRVHDLFERAIVAREEERGDDDTVMTTWHEDESLEEAAWYFAHVASPSPGYAERCRAMVVAAVGNEEWLATLSSGVMAPA